MAKGIKYLFIFFLIIVSSSLVFSDDITFNLNNVIVFEGNNVYVSGNMTSGEHSIEGCLVYTNDYVNFCSFSCGYDGNGNIYGSDSDRNCYQNTGTLSGNMSYGIKINYDGMFEAYSGLVANITVLYDYDLPLIYLNNYSINNNYLEVNVTSIDSYFYYMNLSLYNESGKLISSQITNLTNFIFNMTDLADNTYYFNVTAYDFANNKNSTTTHSFTIDTTPPKQIYNISTTSKTSTSIYWTWTNPTDLDFNHSEVYVNDIFIINTTDEYLNHTNLTPNTNYIIKVYTVDNSGNINNTLINSQNTLSQVTEQEGNLITGDAIAIQHFNVVGSVIIAIMFILMILQVVMKNNENAKYLLYAQGVLVILLLISYLPLFF